MKKFTKKQVQEAREHVANFFEEKAREARQDDDYASHVTEEDKDIILQTRMRLASKIRSGECDSNFTIGQRMYLFLTGTEGPFFPLWKK